MAEEKKPTKLTPEQEKALMRSMRKWGLIMDAMTLTLAAVVVGITYLQTQSIGLSVAVAVGAIGYFVYTKLRPPNSPNS